MDRSDIPAPLAWAWYISAWACHTSPWACRASAWVWHPWLFALMVRKFWFHFQMAPFRKIRFFSGVTVWHLYRRRATRRFSCVTRAANAANGPHGGAYGILAIRHVHMPTVCYAKAKTSEVIALVRESERSERLGCAITEPSDPVGRLCYEMRALWR